MAIRAVLFDFGGVILSSPFEAFARYEAERGLPAGFLRRVNATNPDDNAWAQLERGDIGLEEFAARFATESESLGHRVDGHDVLGLLGGDLRPAMVAAVRRLRDRYLLGLLTNNFPASFSGGATERKRHIDEVLGLFHAVVESSKVGVRKPDPAFYDIACRELSIAPDEAVFLDDLGVNLKPARAMGMHTIKVLDADQALSDLAAALGIPLT